MRTFLDKVAGNLHKAMAWPAIILFAVFFLYPCLSSIGYSLTDYNGINQASFVGLDNFRRFLTDTRALHAVKNTVIFGLSSAFLLNIFGLAYALLVDKNTRLRRVGRTVVYLPVIISGLIMGYIWRMILSNQTGSLYKLMASAGLEGSFPNWLSDVNLAIWAVIIVNVWQYVGSPMIIYLAGLQSISPELLEAAHIDGAGYASTLFRVKLPLLLPSIRINIITNIIASLGVFDVIQSLTEGGPGFSTLSLSMYIYRNAFNGRTGYATAVSVVLLLIIIIPVAISFGIMRKKDDAL